jgi:hypothetical protein
MGKWTAVLVLMVTIAVAGPAVAQEAEAVPWQEASLTFAGWPDLPSLEVRSRFFGHQAAVDRDTTDGELAYDYCPFLMKDTLTGTYRLYAGGRWLRRGTPGADGDHVLQYVSKSGAPGSFFMPRFRPEFWLPQEEGQTDLWYSCNCLEPEVLRVGGRYLMYTQIQGNPAAPAGTPGVTETPGVDRIVLFTSDDGFSWQRDSTARGVVVNLEEPERTALHHEEVIYVPWDADGLPYWMYVAADVGGQPRGYFRVRSADPTTFDWSKAERAGLAQYGNQIGYVRDLPGGPLFVRISFTGREDGKTVPSLQFSRDGLNWVWGDAGPTLLAGSEDEGANRNCYFLGLSTLDGTGELEATAPGQYRALYVATTCATSVAPEIFDAEIGLGEMTLTPGP